MTSIKPYYAAWLEDSDEYYVHSLCETEEEVYTFLKGLNLSVPLGESGVQVVEISKQLFDYLQEVRYKNCSKVTKSFVDPKTLEINPQPRVKWDDICTFGQQFTPILDKARKQNRKNKRV